MTIGLAASMSGCDAAAAFRHEDEIAQSVVDNEAQSATGDGTASTTEPGNQHWTDKEVTNTQCGDAEQTLTGVRVGSHEGFDRVVFDFSGDTLPCYRVFFDPNPQQDGSGNPVHLGSNYQGLRVEVSGLGPEFPTIPPGFSSQLSGPAVSYAFFDTFFEGVATNFIAVRDGSAQFSVEFLPGKLIVDVRTATT